VGFDGCQQHFVVSHHGLVQLALEKIIDSKSLFRVTWTWIPQTRQMRFGVALCNDELGAVHHALQLPGDVDDLSGMLLRLQDRFRCAIPSIVHHETAAAEFRFPSLIECHGHELIRPLGVFALKF